MPRLSKRIRRAIEPSRSRKRAWRGSSQSFSRWETKPGDEHEVDRPVAGHLVGDAEVAAARVADRRANRRRGARWGAHPRRAGPSSGPDGGCAARAAGAPARGRCRAASTSARAAALERMQRVGLPAAAVEREHQLAAQALAKRVLRDERLELRHQLVVAAEREVSVDAILERRETQLLQPSDLALRERPRIAARPAAPRARARAPRAGRPTARPDRRALAPARPATRTGRGRPRRPRPAGDNRAGAS